MSRDYDRCIKKKLIVRQELASDLIKPEIESARNDLGSARKTYEDADYKWSTIQAYYSMFHAARALLRYKGFREKSHACLKYVIEALYVETGALGKKHLSDFDTTMLLREAADYKSDFSREGADSSIAYAARFLERAEKILATANEKASEGI